MIRAATIAALLAASGSAAAATPGTPVDAYPGITYTVWTTDVAPATTIHVVEIDLSSAEITVVATAPGERGQTVSEFAAGRGAHVAINGDLFSPQGFVPAGLARGDSTTWDDTADDALSGLVQIAKTVAGTEIAISDPEEEVIAIADEINGAVGGRPLLVVAGAPQTPECDDTPTLACVAAPRTAVAIDGDGRRFYIIVADGWQATSRGLTAAELAIFISSDLDARRALMLDSGSASSLFIDNQGGLVSSPSDGVERPVANHISVIFGALPAGVIQGGVFDTVIGGDPIPGTRVRADTGETATYDGSMLWSFVVPPRWVCVTGSAPGFQDQTQCRQIRSGESEFASLALIPEGAPGFDGGVDPGTDAGTTPPPGEGCACRTSSRAGSFWLLAALALLLRRRRCNMGRCP